MSRLRQRLIEDLQIRNYAPRTIRVYVDRVAKFAQHFGQSPDRLGPAEIRAFQLFLTQTKKSSWAEVNQTVCALRFLYKVCLGRPYLIEHIPFPKQPKKLPVVLSRQEIQRVLAGITNLKHRTMVMTRYATGVRLAEALALHVHDIDSGRMLVLVRQGKGGKDRYVPLSETLLEQLRPYWRGYRPPLWLFPSTDPRRALSHSALQRVCCRAGRKAGLNKRVSPHTLRHRFATHLLGEAGGRHGSADDPGLAGPSLAAHHLGLPACGQRSSRTQSRLDGSAASGARGEAMSQPRHEVAEVFRRYQDEYLAACSASPQQRRVIGDLVACRPAALGGHLRRCDGCGHEQIAYNSCRNRHCPQCQGSRQAQRLEAQSARLLEVPYFHVVFTLPQALGPLALQNKRLLYGLLVRSAAETLQAVARDEKHLGARIGFTAVLHSWGQTLLYHPHLHCLVPGGGLSADGQHWIEARAGFFLPVRVLGRLFRGKYLA